MFCCSFGCKRPANNVDQTVPEKTVGSRPGELPADDELPAIYEENTFCEAECDDASAETNVNGERC